MMITMPTRSLPTRLEMIRAFETRDASFDGLFITAVKTTGIFCRPTCSARKPNHENIEFFASPREALTAGYRPCKRCRPMEDNEAVPEWVRELLELVERAPTTRFTAADLRARSIDPARARRWFKQHYGMTFAAYQRSIRLGAALSHLRRGSDLTAVGLRHGFESASGFREAFERLFGDPPGRGRRAQVLTVQWMDTPIGPFIAGAVDEGICLFEFADRRALEAQIAAIRKAFKLPAVPGTHPHLEQLERQVERYFNGASTSFDVPIVLRGTPFQECVWNALCAIPFGETRSYDDIARTIGRPAAHRAVGRANGQNRLAVIVPCHRVVGADGTLTGYGGGLWRKQYLLDLERRIAFGDR